MDDENLDELQEDIQKGWKERYYFKFRVAIELQNRKKYAKVDE